MAVSKSQMCNKALTKLGEQPITNLSDDTERARVLNRVYELSLKTILSEGKWNFAVKRANLTELDVTLAWTYAGEAYVYQKPTDMIRIFDKSSSTATFREEGDYIISDTSGLGVLYVYYLDDPAKYSASFVEAFIDRLCADIAYMIVNSASLGVICSTSSLGYWYFDIETATHDEIEKAKHSWLEMKSRAMNMLKDCDKQLDKLNSQPVQMELL